MVQKIIKHSKFEKNSKKDMKSEMTTQEEKSDSNCMSIKSSSSSNLAEDQVLRIVIKQDFLSKKNKAANPFGNGRNKNRWNYHTSYLRAVA